MNQAFSQPMIQPNLPLRRPSSSPSPLTPKGPGTSIQEFAKERLLASDILDGPKGDTVRKDISQNLRNVSSPPQTAGPMMGPLVKLCNYCSRQGSLRCTRCKKTSYCSEACQAQDWKAHRHICRPSIPEGISVKPKECPVVPCGNGLPAKEISVDVEPKRRYRHDLHKHHVSKGTEIQATVIDIKDPGKFFVHLQSEEIIKSMKNIIINLQKTNGTPYSPKYKPEVGEICTAKFSVDRNWYRAEVQSVDVASRTASVFYIDFGNEENVTFDNLRPLSDNIDPVPSFALQCCVAGVKPLTGSWTDESNIAVKQLIAGKSLTFSVFDVMNDGALFAVDVPVTSIGKYLSTFLIEQGYAIKEDVPVKPETEQDINSLLTASFENFKRLSVGKNENSEARPPDPLTQGVGDTFTAIVTHLQSPSEILCQKLENASVIQQLQVNLRDHCSNMPASENFRPAPGTICCSLFSEDSQWYRAKVLAYSSENRVCIGYIDFGNSEETELNRLRPISKELLALATQAIPCSLAGIKSPTGTWSDEAILMLKRLLCNRFIRVGILGQKDGRALVSMIDESSDPQANIAEVFVNMGYALTESEEMEMNDPADASFSEMPPLSPPVVEKMEWTCAELPVDGQKVELVISTVKSIDEFYCYNYSEPNEQSLAKLSFELMKHCESETAPFTPTVGEPCCALFTGDTGSSFRCKYNDATWYRAMVLEICGEGMVRVYFVDFGNTCEVEAVHLKAINQSLLKLPFQAIRCWLAGVEPVAGQWSKEALSKFRVLCVGLLLSGRVVSITEKGYGMTLESAGQSIASVLISEQLVKPYGQVKQPPRQTIKPTNQSEDLPALKPLDQNPPPEEPFKVNKEAASPPEDSTASSTYFPLNWKTLELPCGDTFQPRVAAVISPSLFYVLNPGQVNVEGLKTVMTDVAKYCSKQPVHNLCHPLPGAACCAQFSGDKNWYRAVVLEVTSKHAHVIYADYGNMETVAMSSILPITKELLQHPFQIVRCALTGKEHFPAVWPTEVLELFGIQLNGGVLASVKGFDGTVNLLNLTQKSGQASGDINSIILGALQKEQHKPNSMPAPIGIEGHNILDRKPSLTVSSGEAADQTQSAEIEKPDLEDQAPASRANYKPENMPKTVTRMECTEPHNITSSKGGSASKSCCCLDLKQKIDHIEELILLLVKLVKPQTK